MQRALRGLKKKGFEPKVDKVPSRGDFREPADFGTLSGLRDSELTKLVGWPGYRVYRHEIGEKAKTVQLWIRRKRGTRKPVLRMRPETEEGARRE